MFVDASALVAIVTAEAEAETFRDRIAASSLVCTSGLAVFEATNGIARIMRVDLSRARLELQLLIDAFAIEIAPITPEDGEAALAAQARFGKGRHPARLNMGDCFAYAMARNRGLALLYKGDDFAQTDILGAH